MIQAMNRTAARATFLGVLLMCAASVAGVATAEPNAAAPDRGGAPPAQESTGGAATPKAPASRQSKRNTRRGQRRRTADRAPGALPRAGRAKRPAEEPSPLPKLVGKKPVSDDPLGGLKP
jgi:hypothetical protein